jgi:RNA polymerase sigma factor (sigma-70 family)
MTDRFNAAFEGHHETVLAYALRRVSIEADAEDVVAETFGVAWRRLDQLPEPELVRAWLLGIARRVIANQRRGTARRFRLTLRLRAEPRPVASRDAGDSHALEALARLPPDDQELLRLLAWEGLTQAEAGVVLGITANAVAIRLYRARRRFADEHARVDDEDLKGSGSDRTSNEVEARMPGRRHRREHAP